MEWDVITEDFIYDPDVLKFFLTPAFLISFLASLVSPYIVSPPLWKAILPAHKNPPRSDKHFHTMLSSTVHAVVSSSLCVYIMWYGLMGTNRIFSHLPLGFTTMQISLGYFIGDFIVCLLDPKLRSDTGSMIHHVAGIVGVSLSLFHQGKAMFFVIYRLFSECSTPFVNLRSILSDIGEKDRTLYIYTGVSMLITFLLCRIVVIPWHWYEILKTVMSVECTLLIPLFFRVWLGVNYLVFDILNIYWAYKIIKGAVKLYTTKMKKES